MSSPYHTALQQVDDAKNHCNAQFEIMSASLAVPAVPFSDTLDEFDSELASLQKHVTRMETVHRQLLAAQARLSRASDLVVKKVEQIKRIQAQFVSTSGAVLDGAWRFIVEMSSTEIRFVILPLVCKKMHELCRKDAQLPTTISVFDLNNFACGLAVARALTAIAFRSRNRRLRVLDLFSGTGCRSATTRRPSGLQSRVHQHLSTTAKSQAFAFQTVHDALNKVSQTMPDALHEVHFFAIGLAPSLFLTCSLGNKVMEMAPNMRSIQLCNAWRHNEFRNEPLEGWKSKVNVTFNMQLHSVLVGCNNSCSQFTNIPMVRAAEIAIFLNWTVKSSFCDFNTNLWSNTRTVVLFESCISRLTKRQTRSINFSMGPLFSMAITNLWIIGSESGKTISDKSYANFFRFYGFELKPAQKADFDALDVRVPFFKDNMRLFHAQRTPDSFLEIFTNARMVTDFAKRKKMLNHLGFIVSTNSNVSHAYSSVLQLMHHMRTRFVSKLAI